MAKTTTILACTILLSAASRVQPQPSDTYLQKSRTFHSPAEFAQLTHGAVRMQKTAKPADELRVRRLPIHLPVNDFTIIATESPTVTWIGSAEGAVRLNTSTRTVEYFAGERWLPDDRVTALRFDQSAPGGQTG